MKLVLVGKLWHGSRRRWQALVGRVIGAFLVFGLVYHFGNATSSSSAATLKAASATVDLADIVQIVQAAGQLQPKRKVEVGAQVSGQVRQLHVQLGQTVKAGDLLVSLDSDSGRNAVDQAQAALAQQIAIMKGARVVLAASRREAERQRRLLEGDATTLSDKDKADTELAKLEAQQLVDEAQLKQKRADLVDKQLKLTYTRVSAPIDGEVVGIAVQEGQTINALQIAPTLVTLAQMNPMTVKAHIAEAEIGFVRVGQAAHITTLAATRPYDGKVRVIQPIPERSGNALFYNVLIDVDNADHHLLSEMTVQVELEVARVTRGPTLPITALDQRVSAGCYTVQVLDASGNVRLRQVNVGIRDAERVQILDGLKLGERVLLLPLRLPPAAR